MDVFVCLLTLLQTTIGLVFWELYSTVKRLKLLPRRSKIEALKSEFVRNCCLVAKLRLNSSKKCSIQTAKLWQKQENSDSFKVSNILNRNRTVDSGLVFETETELRFSQFWLFKIGLALSPETGRL